MLVTCPECSEKISSEVDPCPKCGLPGAGKMSKEYNENYIERHGIIYPGGKMEYGNPRRCSNCGYTSPHWKRSKPKLIKANLGYSHTNDMAQCPKCGTFKHEYDLT